MLGSEYRFILDLEEVLLSTCPRRDRALSVRKIVASAPRRCCQRGHVDIFLQMDDEDAHYQLEILGSGGHGGELRHAQDHSATKEWRLAGHCSCSGRRNRSEVLSYKELSSSEVESEREESESEKS